jgi:pyruvate/2-oxoglutarate dehydrogenase complex dihydrolipoamide acyltransferase (E2) component
LGIDLASVEGTGKGGSILKADVLAAAHAPTEVAVNPPAEQPSVSVEGGAVVFWECEEEGCGCRYSHNSPHWTIQRRNHMRRAHGITVG